MLWRMGIHTFQATHDFYLQSGGFFRILCCRNLDIMKEDRFAKSIP